MNRLVIAVAVLLAGGGISFAQTIESDPAPAKGSFVAAPPQEPETPFAVPELPVAAQRKLPLRVRADHLAVIALSVGRAKDLTRILALLESGSVDREAIKSVAARHNLLAAWQRFEGRFLDD